MLVWYQAFFYCVGHLCLLTMSCVLMTSRGQWQMYPVYPQTRPPMRAPRLGSSCHIGGKYCRWPTNRRAESSEVFQKTRQLNRLKTLPSLFYFCSRKFCVLYIFLNTTLHLKEQTLKNFAAPFSFLWNKKFEEKQSSRFASGLALRD